MTNQIFWFSEEAGFYGPDYLVEYEEILPHERTIAEVDFIEKTLKLPINSHVLDVPCGHGRHMIELAKRGYNVCGSDLNRFFLSEAQNAAKISEVKIELHQCDMRELSFDNQFDVILNLFTSMGFFEHDKDDVSFLEGVYRALKPNGQFFLDFVNRNWLTKNLRQKDWRKLSDGTILLIEREYDEVSGRKFDHRIKIQNGIVGATTTISQRIYSTTELVSMAEKVGFHLTQTFGDFIGNQLTINSRRTILCFKK